MSVPMVVLNFFFVASSFTRVFCVSRLSRKGCIHPEMVACSECYQSFKRKPIPLVLLVMFPLCRLSTKTPLPSFVIIKYAFSR